MRPFFQSIFFLCVLSIIFYSEGILAQDSYHEQLRKPQYKIGVVTDGPSVNIPNLISIFTKEIRELAADDFSVVFPDNKSLEGDASQNDIKRKIDTLISDQEIDLVLSLGTIASAEATKMTNLPKPVVAPFIFDADWQKVPRKENASGVPNLFYIDLDVPIDQELIDFRKLVPFKKLGLLFDQRDIDGIPSYKKISRYLSYEHSIKVELVPVGSDVQKTLSAIPEDIKAVMVGPLWQLSQEKIADLGKGFIQRGIASFSLASYTYVDNGFFATNMTEDSIRHLARQVAINIQEILLGEDPATLPNGFAQSDKLTINMATARAIKIYPSLDYMTGARLINEEQKDIERQVTLPQIVEEALTANLDIIVAEREVTAGSHSVKEARSRLFPRLSAGAGGAIIDDDRASLSGGVSPERTLTGSLQAIMEIYSENSWAGYTAEKFLQEGRKSDRDRVKLDIILEASTAYLDVLRQHTIERLQKENMQLTQANLDRAQIRLSTGVAGPDELYRWETQFARDRQVVLRAESSTRDAKQRLNRILNRPLLEDFIAKEAADKTDPLEVGSDRLFYELIHNPLYFERFNGFALEQGLLQSPELKVIDAAIAAQERVVLQAKREYWVPTVTIEGDLSYLFADGGAGTRDEELTGLDDTDWQVGIFARLPLYEGGRKGAAVGRNQELLTQLKTEKLATEDRVGQQILQALNNTRASFPAINLSRDAAYSAERNLKLVTDSYVEGIKSVIDLLDAQNQALNADLDAANAVYNFLIDFMGLQRSVGVFVSFLPEEEQQQWTEQVRSFLKSQHNSN